MHVIFYHVEINLKLVIIISSVSMLLCAVKENGTIGQKQEKCNKIRFGAQSLSKYQNEVKLHEVILFCNRNCKILQVFFHFSQMSFENLQFWYRQSWKTVYLTLICQNISMNCISSCMIQLQQDKKFCSHNLRRCRVIAKIYCPNQTMVQQKEIIHHHLKKIIACHVEPAHHRLDVDLCLFLNKRGPLVINFISLWFLWRGLNAFSKRE